MPGGEGRLLRPAFSILQSFHNINYHTMKITERILSLKDKIVATALYCWEGVWRDPSNTLKVRVIKTLNLCVHTFLDTGLQARASSLVYSTLLAIVPAFALLFAIGRGFGLQNLLSSELYRFFPAQAQAINTAMGFIDSYLAQASQGLFVGIGVAMLLWTLISLLSDIENAFNNLWGIKTGRNFYRKITDYTAICLLVPVLMMCSAGINIFMATFMKSVFGQTMLSPLVNIVLDCAPFLLCCVAFTISFLIIPNTQVRFKYAAIAGFICGIAFQLLQTLFITGQVYVAKYNAIYGSFAFLPLLLIWLQLSWLIILFGCTLTFSLQNIFRYTFTAEISDISPVYMRKLTVVTAAVITTRFVRGLPLCTIGDISADYGLPIRIVRRIVEKLHSAGIIYYVEVKGDARALAPAVELSRFTLGDLLTKMELEGGKDFVPGFSTRYAKVEKIVDTIMKVEVKTASSVLLADIIVE